MAVIRPITKAVNRSTRNGAMARTAVAANATVPASAASWPSSFTFIELEKAVF
jgi:hypothetical protein